jgi:predicted Zn-dependent peptidase
MNTQAKELAKNWQELSRVAQGWGEIILSRFAKNKPPYRPHLEVMAELKGEGVLAADPIGMESHSPAFFNVRVQRHLTSTDVREA